MTYGRTIRSAEWERSKTEMSRLINPAVCLDNRLQAWIEVVVTSRLVRESCSWDVQRPLVSTCESGSGWR